MKHHQGRDAASAAAQRKVSDVASLRALAVGHLRSVVISSSADLATAVATTTRREPKPDVTSPECSRRSRDSGVEIDDLDWQPFEEVVDDADCSLSSALRADEAFGKRWTRPWRVDLRSA